MHSPGLPVSATSSSMSLTWAPCTKIRESAEISVRYFGATSRNVVGVERAIELSVKRLTKGVIKRLLDGSHVTPNRAALPRLILIINCRPATCGSLATSCKLGSTLSLARIYGAHSLSSSKFVSCNVY